MKRTSYETVWEEGSYRVVVGPYGSVEVVGSGFSIGCGYARTKRGLIKRINQAIELAHTYIGPLPEPQQPFVRRAIEEWKNDHA